MRRATVDQALFSITRAGMLGAVTAVAVGGSIIGLDAGNFGGPGVKYIGILTVTPFIAAAFGSPLIVGAVGLTALGGAFVYGDHRGVADSDAQLIRLCAIALATLLAMVVSFVRTVHERRISTLQRVAEVAQQAILRSVPPPTSGVRCALLYRSAMHDARIGGDLYEVLDTRFGTRVLIGDVKGKGLEAVRLASVVLGAFRHVAHERACLVDIAHDLDTSVRRAAGIEDFVTCVIAEVDNDGNVNLVNCGHPPPLLVDNGVVRFCAAEPSPPLGIDIAPSVLTLHMDETSQMLLYTDGLTEARNSKGDYFPLDALAGKALDPRALDQGLERLKEMVVDHTAGRLDDDVALLALTRFGALPRTDEKRARLQSPEPLL